MTTPQLHVVHPDESTQSNTATGWQRIFLGAHSSSPSPLVMGLTHQGPYSQSPLISHSTSEVCFITKGRGFMISGHAEHPFAPGDALHIEPGCWHAIKTEAQEVEMLYLFPGPELPSTTNAPLGP